MIAKHISTELTGLHLTAFKAFGKRKAVTTTPQALKYLIETTPEFKNLSEQQDEQASPQI